MKRWKKQCKINKTKSLWKQVLQTLSTKLEAKGNFNGQNAEIQRDYRDYYEQLYIAII